MLFIVHMICAIFCWLWLHTVSKLTTRCNDMTHTYRLTRMEFVYDIFICLKPMWATWNMPYHVFCMTFVCICGCGVNLFLLSSALPVLLLTPRGTKIMPACSITKQRFVEQLWCCMSHMTSIILFMFVFYIVLALTPHSVISLALVCSITQAKWVCDIHLWRC